MAVIPDEFQAPQGGLSQAASPAENPTRVAPNATIDEEAPVDPIAKAMEKMSADRAALDAQIAKLSKSLEARQNLPFNPMYLDIARAAAKPASTGSAIEALGNIGGAYGDAYLKENQRQIDIGKDQLDLAKQRQALSQVGLEQQLMANFVRGPQAKPMPTGASAGAPPVAPTLGGASTAPPALAQSPAQAAPAKPAGAGAAPPPPDVMQSGRMRRITDADIAMYNVVAPTVGKALADLSKLQRDAQVVSTEGIWDTISSSWVVKFQASIKRPIRVLGDQEMTKDTSAQYDQMMDKLERSGASEEQKDQAVAEFAAANGLGGVRKTADGQITGFQSASQKKLSEKESEQAMLDKREENKASRVRVYDAGTRAQATKQAAQTTYRLATDKETMGAFGVLNKPGVLNAIAIAVAQFTDRGSFGAAGLEQAVRNAGGTEKEIQAASYVVSLQGQLQLMAAQDYLKGQGAVSDAERRLIANLVGSLSDTPKSVAMKAKVIEARANFDQLVADAYYEYEQKNPTGTVQDFYRQKDGPFKTLFKEYDEHMSGLYSHYFGTSKPAAKAPPASAPPASAPAPAAKAPPRAQGPLERRLNESKKAGS
jgi:hypothetical protein